jgi:hypothetical protein
MSEAEVADVFGIELEPRSAAAAPAVDVPAPPPPISAPASAPAARRAAQREHKIPQRLSAMARARIAAAAKVRWAKLKKQPHDRIRTLHARKRSAAKASPPGAKAPQVPKEDEASK